MTRHRLPTVAVLMAALLFAVMAPAPTATAATVDTVVEWNGYATTALISQQIAPLNAPPVATLLLAMVHGAVYDAVNAIDGGYQPYLVSPPTMSWYSKDAAAATAAYRVLKDPSLKVTSTQLTVLDGYYATWLASTPDNPARAGGIGVGEAAAKAMLDARKDDGRFDAGVHFIAGTGAGQWRPELPAFVSDPNAWVAKVKPFLVNSQDQFRSSGPDALTSAEYAADFNEVKAIGSKTSVTRTADQTDAGLFWTDNATAMWSRIFRQLSAARGLTLVENARFFAMLYLTGADALITVWADKAYGASGDRSARSAARQLTGTLRPKPIQHGSRCSPHHRTPTTPQVTPA
jgi:hypothetical protein